MNHRLLTKVRQIEHYYEQKNTEAFFSQIDDVLQQLKKDESHDAWITLMMHKASLYVQLYNYTLATSALAEVAEIIHTKGNVAQQIQYYIFVASLQQANGQYDETFFEGTYALLKEIRHVNSPTLEATALNNLGTYLLKNERYEEGIGYFLEAARILERHPEEFFGPLSFYLPLNIISTSYALNNKEQAAKYVEQLKQYREHDPFIDVFIDVIDDTIDHTFETASPVLYDGIIVAATFDDARLQRKVRTFCDETFDHYKPLAFMTDTSIASNYEGPGIETTIDGFIDALALGRHFDRDQAIG